MAPAQCFGFSFRKVITDYIRSIAWEKPWKRYIVIRFGIYWSSSMYSQQRIWCTRRWCTPRHHRYDQSRRHSYCRTRLHNLVRSAVDSKQLKASLTPERVMSSSSQYPLRFERIKQPDHGMLKQPHEPLSISWKNNLVHLESTSPVGTTERITQFFWTSARSMLGQYNDIHCTLSRTCSSRKILQEIIENDRIVGGISLIQP